MSTIYSAYCVPAGFILVGTCGACGGPLLTPQLVQSTSTERVKPHISCADCHRVAKVVEPNYGPIMEMLPMTPTPPAQETLKPCPFCGKPPVIGKMDHNYDDVGCGDLNCAGSWVQETPEKWNRRASGADTTKEAQPHELEKCSGPFTDARDCPVHGRDLHTASPAQAEGESNVGAPQTEMPGPWKGWRNARPRYLEPFYSKWVGLLTSEGLHAKSDIATVLAMLDAACESLRGQVAEAQSVCRTHAAHYERERERRKAAEQRAEALAVVVAEHKDTIRGMVERMVQLNIKMDAAERLAEEREKDARRMVEYTTTIFRDWRVAHYTTRAERSEIPTAQISILADMDASAFRMALDTALQSGKGG